MSEPRDRKRAVVGDTNLCQKCCLTLKDVQIPKTFLPESHCLSMCT